MVSKLRGILRPLKKPGKQYFQDPAIEKLVAGFDPAASLYSPSRATLIFSRDLSDG